MQPLLRAPARVVSISCRTWHSLRGSPTSHGDLLRSVVPRRTPSIMSYKINSLAVGTGCHSPVDGVGRALEGCNCSACKKCFYIWSMKTTYSGMDEATHTWHIAVSPYKSKQKKTIQDDNKINQVLAMKPKTAGFQQRWRYLFRHTIVPPPTAQETRTPSYIQASLLSQFALADEQLMMWTRTLRLPCYQYSLIFGAPTMIDEHILRFSVIIRVACRAVSPFFSAHISSSSVRQKRPLSPSFPALLGPHKAVVNPERTPIVFVSTLSRYDEVVVVCRPQSIERQLRVVL